MKRRLAIASGLCATLEKQVDVLRKESMPKTGQIIARGKRSPSLLTSMVLQLCGIDISMNARKR